MSAENVEDKLERTRRGVSQRNAPGKWKENSLKCKEDCSTLQEISHNWHRGGEEWMS